MDYDDEDEDVPAATRNNGNEEAHTGPVAQATSSKDSVWLDREEDKMIQNVKRKPLSNTEAREKDSELLKRRKTSIEASCSTEGERLPAEEAVSMERPETTKPSFSAHEGKGCSAKEEGKSAVKIACTKGPAEASGGPTVDTNKGVEAMGAATNGPSLVKAHHGAAGS